MSNQPGDESLPAGSPFADLPGSLLETLRRSYRERKPGSWHLANGFAGEQESPKTKSFSQVLDGIGAACMATIGRVFERAKSCPNLWDHVWTIRESWSPGSSEGFMFNSKNPAAMRQILTASPGFCGDLPPGESMHQMGEHGQNRHCFRELGQVGRPGLHICLVKPGMEDSDGGAHNFHIDLHQLAKAKTMLCSCWYAGLNGHFRDVGDWIVDKFLADLEEKLAAKAQQFGPLGTFAVKELSAHYKADLKAWLLRKMLRGSDAFDNLEGMIDEPPPMPGDLFGKITTPLIRQAMIDFKRAYMLTM